MALGHFLVYLLTAYTSASVSQSAVLASLLSLTLSHIWLHRSGFGPTVEDSVLYENRYLSLSSRSWTCFPIPFTSIGFRFQAFLGTFCDPLLLPPLTQTESYFWCTDATRSLWMPETSLFLTRKWRSRLFPDLRMTIRCLSMM